MFNIFRFKTIFLYFSFLHRPRYYVLGKPLLLLQPKWNHSFAFVYHICSLELCGRLQPFHDIGVTLTGLGDDEVEKDYV